MSDRTRTKLWNPIKLLGIAFLILLSSSACIMTFSLPSSSPNAAPIQPEQTKGSNPDLEREVIAQATNLAVLATQVSQLAADLEAQQGLIRYLATRGPALPPTLQVPGSPTPYLPLRGILEIENGKCCVGGIAGESTMIRVALLAESPYGEVTGMRVSAGGTPRSSQAFEQVPWQPYLPSISFEIPIATNWTGFYVQAQFKDALGNLSPVYIDDISVEGMPSPLTPTP